MITKEKLIEDAKKIEKENAWGTPVPSGNWMLDVIDWLCNFFVPNGMGKRYGVSWIQSGTDHPIIQGEFVNTTGVNFSIQRFSQGGYAIISDAPIFLDIKKVNITFWNNVTLTDLGNNIIGVGTPLFQVGSDTIIGVTTIDGMNGGVPLDSLLSGGFMIEIFE